MFSLSITGPSDLAKGLVGQVTIVLPSTASLLIILSAVVWGHADTQTHIVTGALEPHSFPHPVLTEARLLDVLGSASWADDSVNWPYLESTASAGPARKPPAQGSFDSCVFMWKA